MLRTSSSSVRLTEVAARRLNHNMRFLPSIRAVALGFAACGFTMAYGQTLPATQPTLPSPQSQVQAAPQAQTAAQQPPQRPVVELNSGILTVSANNSSLNQILREISRVTGMKITGGVTDERVFGNYGPADPSAVLSSLINGTGSNMMVVLDAQQRPQELVLTPRGGGPTPPNPNASRERGEEDLPPQRGQRFQRPEGVQNNFQQNPMPQQVPIQQQQPIPQPQLPQFPAPPAASTGDTTNQQSPNGVPTPQQIYEQLMKNKQLQQQQPPQ